MEIRSLSYLRSGWI